VIVALAVCGLPAGPARARYRKELIADLYDLDSQRQIREAISMLTHSGALRSAVAPTDALQERHYDGDRKPLLCYVHHHLRSFFTADGVPYRRCIRCGEDHYDGRGDNNLTGNVIATVINSTPNQ
jgi:hypothetical protein